MESTFMEKYKELIEKMREIEYAKRSSLEKIKECSDELTELSEKLSELPVPTIDGQPVIRLSIDTSKLGNYAYVHKLKEEVPLILQKLEDTGTEMINKINMR